MVTRLHWVSWVLLLAVAFGSNSLLDNDAQVMSLDETMGVKVADEFKYHKIPGLIMTPNSRAVPTAKTVGACQTVCNKEPNCKSYSYDPIGNKCIWSSDHLKYDPDFVLNIKPTGGEETKYMELAGMYNSDKGWTKSKGRTQEQCQLLCDKGGSCKMYAYRQRDDLCMMTSNTLGLNEHFDYYEKEGVPTLYHGYPDHPAGEEPSSTETNPTETPAALKQQINAEKAQLSAEKKAVAESQAEVAHIKEGAAAQEKALGNKEEEEVVLKQKLAQVKEWSQREMAAGKEESKLKVKASEVKGKSTAIKEQQRVEEVEAEKQSDQAEEAAKEKVVIEMQGARAEAKAKVDEATLDKEKAVAHNELEKAVSQQGEAKTKMKEDEVKIEALKVSNEKKDQEYKSELDKMAKHTQDEEEKISTDEKTQLQSIDLDKKKAVEEAKRQVVAQMEENTSVQLTEMAEKQQKEDVKEKSLKKVEKDKTAEQAAEVSQLKFKIADQRSETQHLEKQIANAKAEQLVTKRSVAIATQKAKVDAAHKIAQVRLEAQLQAEAAAQKAREVQLAAAERVRKIEAAAAKQALGHKEGNSKFQINNEPPQVEEAAQEGVQTVKEVAQKASLLPEAEGQQMLEQAKTEYRTRVRNVEESANTEPTKYIVHLDPSSNAVVKSVTEPNTDVELGEGAAPNDSVQQLQASDTPGAQLRESLALKQHGASASTPAASGIPQSQCVNNAAGTYMSAQNGDVVHLSFVKYPIEPLPEGDILDGATLTLNKVCGAQSSATVTLTSCEYDSEKVDFDSRPASLAVLTNDQIFPALDGTVQLTLNPIIVARYIKDSELCLEIGGGPAEEPVLFSNPQIKFDVAKPAPDMPAPISLQTGATVARRRRSTIAMTADLETDTATQLRDDAIKEQEAIADKLGPELEHKMRLRLPVALEERIEEITRDLKLADARLRKMKTEVLHADPVFKHQITEEEMAKANVEIEKELEVQLPKRVRELRQAYIEAQTKQIYDAVKHKETAKTNKIKTIKYKDEQDRAMDILKTQKITAAKAAEPPVTEKEISDGIKQDLDKYTGDLKTKNTPLAEEHADAEINKLAMQKAVEVTKDTIPGQITAAALAKIVPDVAGAVQKQLDESADKIFAVKVLEEKQKDNADGAALIAGDKKTATNSEKTAANRITDRIRDDAKRSVETDENKLAVTATVKEELLENAKSALAQEVTDTTIAAQTKIEEKNLANRRSSFESQYMTEHSAASVAAKKKQLEAAWKAQELESRHAATAARIAQAITEQERQAISKVTKEKVDQIEDKTLEINIAVQFKEAKHDPKFKKRMDDHLPVLTRKATLEIKNIVSPALLETAKVKAEERIKAEMKVKEEQMESDMDTKLEAEIKAKTQASLLYPEVKAAEEAKLKVELARQVLKQGDEQMSTDGMKMKLQKAIKEKYWEGTLKTSQAFVLQEFGKAYKTKYDTEAQNNAKTTVDKIAVDKIDRAMELTATKLTQQMNEMKLPKLQMEINEAIIDMEPADQARIKASLTKESGDAVAITAKEQTEAKRAEVTESIRQTLMAEELLKEQAKSSDRMRQELKEKSEEVARAAIEKKIELEFAKVTGAVQKQEVRYVDTPLRKEEEIRMVSQAGHEAAPVNPRAAPAESAFASQQTQHLQQEVAVAQQQASEARNQTKVIAQNMQQKEEKQVVEEVARLDAEQATKDAVRNPDAAVSEDANGNDTTPVDTLR